VISFLPSPAGKVRDWFAGPLCGLFETFPIGGSASAPTEMICAESGVPVSEQKFLAKDKRGSAGQWHLLHFARHDPLDRLVLRVRDFQPIKQVLDPHVHQSPD
jgi:hypothetical protein